MISMGGSGGVKEDDPLADFKISVSTFVQPGPLDEAIKRLESGRDILWKELANWDDLTLIRDTLDQLPDSDGSPKAAATSTAVAESEFVTLFPMNHVPQAIVSGAAKNRLTKAQYNIVQALLKAGDQGLSKAQLKTKSRHPGAVDVLKRLARSDEDWKMAIQLPGRPGGGYRIR
jgi:hypothetical protein